MAVALMYWYHKEITIFKVEVTLNWNLACFVHLSEKLKNAIKNLVGLAVLELLFKICKLLFWSVSPEPLALLKIICHFLISQDNLLQDDYIIIQKKCNFEIVPKICYISVWGALSP